MTRPMPTSLTLAAFVVAASLSGCGQQEEAASDPKPASGADSSSEHSHDHDHESQQSGEREVDSLTPRALIAHNRGLTLLDTTTGAVLHEWREPGFRRLANAGDGRHVMVADGDVFRVYDAGIQAHAHGDHDHYYETDPGLTQTEYPAHHAGHVVLHNGQTTLFADGDGTIQVLDSEHIADGDAEVEQTQTSAPHHGVALELADGTLLTTQGTEEERHTVQVLDGEEVLAETTDCPGVHGETTAHPKEQGDVVVLGCENGPVVLRGGEFHKVGVEDAYARTGNLAGHEGSPVVLGDYKVQADLPEGEVERTTRISLIDTRTARSRSSTSGRRTGSVPSRAAPTARRSC